MTSNDEQGKSLTRSTQAALARDRRGLVARGLADIATREHEVVVVDGLMWARDLSSARLSREAAHRYVRESQLGGYADWRLPTDEELEGLIDLTELLKEPNQRRPFPFIEPFVITLDVYVHTGTQVIHEGPRRFDFEYYVMRTYNGHVFNGTPNSAHVLAVRDLEGPDSRPEQLPRGGHRTGVRPCG